MCSDGIIYKGDLDPDPDLQKKGTPDLWKKGTLYQNSLYALLGFFGPKMPYLGIFGLDF